MVFPPGGLEDSFVEGVAEDGVLTKGEPVVVALSGGADSVVLLHLLRFSPGLPDLVLMAAHFDHRMRPESAKDRQWVTGLCRAWGVDLHTGESPRLLTSEEEAREERYRFLLAVKETVHASWLLTGHQLDDQAETVLFRLVRGTGFRGLAGIPRVRSPGLYRPLLSFSRQEILEYALERRIRFRDDPSNRDLRIPRNLLRHDILPRLERGVAHGATASLDRIGRLAEENEEAWASLIPGLLSGVLEEEYGCFFIVREALLAYHPAVRARILREVLGRVGIELDESGTRVVVEFTSSGASGQSVSLPRGYRLVRDFHRFLVRESEEEGLTEALVLDGPSPGSGTLRLGADELQVFWGLREPEGCGLGAGFPLADLEFPLTLRAWAPGDRIQMPYGSKKLKKLFGEARLSVQDRARTPVLVDGMGRVLWVAGFAYSRLVQGSGGSRTFFIGIRNVDII